MKTVFQIIPSFMNEGNVSNGVPVIGKFSLLPSPDIPEKGGED